ncbi:hypothetical protein ACGFN1_43005 [Streptomyces sp. NPDC048685]|uniref:hypothetical protein n=1 Tax=Streptomyces sp. NPDC048685 TaxID=3365584 RepID=UPI00371F17E3
MTRLAGLLDKARADLEESPKNALGEERDSRWRGRRIVRVGSAWHLGVLLLTEDAVFATADVLKVVQPDRRGQVSEVAQQRAELIRRCLLGGFRVGEIVHVGWEAIDLDEGGGPLKMHDGVPFVQLSSTERSLPAEAYLAEQVSILRQ